MNKNGFTLLEVTLFLAITAALVVIAIVGLGPRLRNLRFTEAIRSIETSVTKNFTGSEVGVNSRLSSLTCAKDSSAILIEKKTEESGTGQAAGATSNCVRNGKVAIFRADDRRVEYRNIVSLITPAVTGEACDTFSQLIAVSCYRSTVLSDTPEGATTYSYPNELQQQSANRMVGYLLHPETGERHYFFSEATGEFIGPLAVVNPTTAVSASTNICYSLNNRVAKFTFKNTTSKPELQFEGVCS